MDLEARREEKRKIRGRDRGEDRDVGRKTDGRERERERAKKRGRRKGGNKRKRNGIVDYVGVTKGRIREREGKLESVGRALISERGVVLISDHRATNLICQETNNGSTKLAAFLIGSMTRRSINDRRSYRPWQGVARGPGAGTWRRTGSRRPEVRGTGSVPRITGNNHPY